MYIGPLFSKPVISCVFLCALLIFTGCNGGGGGGGTGGGGVIACEPLRQAEAGEIAIYTVEELSAVRNGLDKSYILMSGLDLSGLEWAPIGASYTNSFDGKFDGNGCSINNLNIQGTSILGLFGYASGAELKNITMVDVNIDGTSYVGGIVGVADSGTSIDNSTVTGAIFGNQYMGGIAGRLLHGSSIKSSHSAVAISTVITAINRAGGIAGDMLDSSITNSYSTGDLNGNTVIGGIAGYMDGGSITKSYSAGDIEATGVYIGGIVGEAESNATITNCIAFNQSISGNPIVGVAHAGASVSGNYALAEMLANGANPVNTLDLFVYDAAWFTESNYKNHIYWDLDSVWTLPAGKYKPILKWQE